MNFALSGAPTPSFPVTNGGRVPAVELSVSSRSQGDHAIVIAAGEIDLYTAPRLHSELAAVINAAPASRVVVDMSGVEFCDSTGMNVLLSSLRQNSVKLAVSDGGGSTVPVESEPTNWAVGGRGLGIVARLSRRWGVSAGENDPGDDGSGETTVWAEVPLRYGSQASLVTASSRTA